MGAGKLDPLKVIQAKGMSEIGYSSRDIANHLGMRQGTIVQVVNSHGRWGEIAKTPIAALLRAEQQAILLAGGRALAAQAMVQTEAALPKASALQAATVFAIMVDKTRILAGEANQIVEVRTTSELSGLDALADALSRRLVSREIDVTPAKIISTAVSPDKT